jgi:hypothetical protein
MSKQMEELNKQIKQFRAMRILKTVIILALGFIVFYWL